MGHFRGDGRMRKKSVAEEFEQKTSNLFTLAGELIQLTLSVVAIWKSQGVNIIFKILLNLNLVCTFC